MKDLCSLAQEKIELFKITKIKQNFSKLEKETDINRHTLSYMHCERREIKASVRLWRTHKVESSMKRTEHEYNYQL